jgi:hypothetical protein
MAFSEAQIKAIGSEILYEFGETFNEILDRQLRETQGEDWFEKSFKTKSKNRDEALRRSGKMDPYTLIHQVTTEKNAIFRAALGREFKLGDLNYLQDQLEKITIARNKWSHPDEVFSQKDLLQLVKPIHRVLGNRSYALGQKCEELIISLEEQTIGSLSHFSRAFGNEFKSIERSNYLLRQELNRYRESSIEKYYSQRTSKLDKARLSKAELEQLLEDSENFLVAQEHERLEIDHVRRSEHFSEKLGRWTLELALLTRLLDEDAFGVALQAGEASSLVRSQFSPLKESEISDLVTALLNELLPMADELKVLRSELGPENCVCFFCELCGKYEILPGTVILYSFTGVIVNHFISVTNQEVLDLVENLMVEWMKSNDLSEDFMDWLFTLPSS